MNKALLINKTEDFVKQKFAKEGTGHDWWHIQRVRDMAMRIAANEKSVDLFVLELAALLHDIEDWKFNDGDMEAGSRAARKWLASIKVEEEVILHIEDIIRNVSFKGAGIPSNLKTIEGKIVHDADKLDALGAIGIARCFAFGGSIGSVMYDPDQKPIKHTTFETYKKMDSSSVTHFYEKLLLLKDRMYTKTGKDIAEHRHKYMEDFLDEFYAEWKSEL